MIVKIMKHQSLAMKYVCKSELHVLWLNGHTAMERIYTSLLLVVFTEFCGVRRVRQFNFFAAYIVA